MTNKDFFPLVKPYLPSQEKLFKYISHIYETRRLTNFGELSKLLEENLKTYLGISNIVLTANGTLALQIAYKLLNIKGIVVTTPFTFVATIGSLAWEKIPFIFTDIDPDTFCIDLNNVEYLLQKYKNIDAIVAVHVFGNSVNMEEILFLKEKYNLKILFDASHCFGVSYNGTSILNYGDISTISFHATKVFHTIEGGGIVINKNKEHLYKKARTIANFGIEDEYYISEIGINAKLNEFAAAMGLALLEEIEHIIKLRKEKWEYYYSNLENVVKLQKRNPLITNNYSYFPVVLPSEMHVLKIISILRKFNIFPKRYFYPSLDKLPYVTQNNIPVQLNNAHYISERILCLPLYHDLPKEVQDIVINVIKEVMENA